MRYINNYNYNTLIIIDSKNNETIGKVLLDVEDIPKIQKYQLKKKQNKQEVFTVRISDKLVGLMSYQKGGQLLDSISADVKIK